MLEHQSKLSRLLTHIDEAVRRLMKKQGNQRVVLGGIHERTLKKVHKGEKLHQEGCVRNVGTWIWEFRNELDNIIRSEFEQQVRSGAQSILGSDISFESEGKIIRFLTNQWLIENGKPPVKEISALQRSEESAFILDQWQVMVLNRLNQLETELRSPYRDGIESTIAHNFALFALPRISEDLKQSFYAASSQQRKELVEGFTGTAQKSVCTISFWDLECWKDADYTEMYLELVRECKVKVRRIFVYKKENVELPRLCETLQHAKSEAGGTLEAKAIREDRLPPTLKVRVKSLWLMDERCGTRSLPYFDKDGKELDTNDNDGQIFWGEPAAREAKFFSILWNVQRHHL